MKLSALTVVILALGVTLACTADSGSSATGTTRCAVSSTYLAAASVTSHTLATSLADAMAFELLGAGGVRDIAALERDYVTDITDLLDGLDRPSDFDDFHQDVSGSGRDVARALDLLSQGRNEDAGHIFLRLADEFSERPILDSLPDWVFNCDEAG